jgi:hypothetical protein
MNFEIFDEDYYLKRYPAVREAIEEGIFSSGLEHFQRFGLQEGRTQVSRYYDEDTYLANNPGVAEAVENGIFVSGLEHFIEAGYEEGRTNISPDYNEDFYLSNNSQIAEFVAGGTFRNGLEHFIRFGVRENRFATNFFEPEYLAKNPGVAAAVAEGIFKTGREHYQLFGQFETERTATFVGSKGDDLIDAFGVGNVEILGVEVGLNETGDRFYESDGSGEFDTLIGSAGADTFVFGQSFANRALLQVIVQTYYAGEGQALIQNFDPNDGDSIELIIRPSDDYNLRPAGADLILEIQDDILAVIEGGASLGLTATENDLTQSKEVTIF